MMLQAHINNVDNIEHDGVGNLFLKYEQLKKH